MASPTIVDDTEFLDALDAEPLTLSGVSGVSGVSGALDDFDLDLLDGSGLEHDADHHFLDLAGGPSSRRGSFNIAGGPSRRGSFNMDLMATGRGGSGSFSMDFADADADAQPVTPRGSTLRSSTSMDFRSIQSSLTEMRIDSVQEDEARLLDCFNNEASGEATEMPTSGPEVLASGPETPASSSSPEAPASSPDAPASSPEALSVKRQGKKGRGRGPRNRSSSPKTPNKRFQRMNSVDFDPPAAPSEDMSVSSKPARSEYSQAQYGEALQNLAESMKRTEASREHVRMLQRNILTPEQRQALSMAKKRLARENREVQQRQQQGSPTSGRVGTWRSSLTKNIGMYMGQVNRQML